MKEVKTPKKPLAYYYGIVLIVHHFTSFIEKMPYETLWCIISLHTKIYERSDLIRQTYYTTTTT